MTEAEQLDVLDELMEMLIRCEARFGEVRESGQAIIDDARSRGMDVRTRLEQYGHAGLPRYSWSEWTDYVTAFFEDIGRD